MDNLTATLLCLPFIAPAVIVLIVLIGRALRDWLAEWKIWFRTWRKKMEEGSYCGKNCRTYPLRRGTSDAS